MKLKNLQMEIIENLSKQEIFNALCKSRNLDKHKITTNIIEKIIDSEIEDKDAYISKFEVWDEDYYLIIQSGYKLHLDEYLLWTKKEAQKFFFDDYGEEIYTDERILKELFIELNDEEKKLIRLALKCNLEYLSEEIM